jgi:hypothetical protein
MAMTKDEFMELYGDKPVKFTNYYKYTFTFKGQIGKTTFVTCHVGGSSDNIYKLDIKVNEEYSINKLCPYCCEVVVADEFGYIIDDIHFDDY